MIAEAWYRRRNDRMLRYAGRVLDPARWIALRADPAFASTYQGQVALLTAANLLGRMTPSLVLDVPALLVVAPLPWAGCDLRRTLLEQLRASDPHTRAVARATSGSEHVLDFGSSGDAIVHASGWNAYVGPGPSPLTASKDPNPVGAAFAAIAAVAYLFVADLPDRYRPQLFNTLSWTTIPTPNDAPRLEDLSPLGTLWTVGVGSVGTAILYFLTLCTRAFTTTIFDHDHVGVENLDRSPIFTAVQENIPKALAAREYLRAVGVEHVAAEMERLDLAKAWSGRQEGTPDLVIAAANEFAVRHHTESGLPPIQIYGTTGRDWQTAMVRHIPFMDPCSRCLFPQDALPLKTRCATGDVTIRNAAGNEKRVDAAMPFLSFAAGLMAAAEILKLQLPGYPFSSNRVLFFTRPDLRLRPISLARRSDCVCSTSSYDQRDALRSPFAMTFMVGGRQRPLAFEAVQFANRHFTRQQPQRTSRAVARSHRLRYETAFPPES